MTARRWLWLLAAPLVATSAAAQTPLSPDELLRAVDRALPLLEQARQAVRVAEGEAREARGGFDLALGGSARTTRGFYDNERAAAYLEQPLAPLGLTVFGGYRIGRGSFAPYDGKSATLSAGEWAGGFELPLLKSRAIDDRRAARRVTELGVEVAERGLDKARLSYFKDALTVYWDWAAAGQQVRIARALLDLAEARDQQLIDASALGQIAPVERTDNLRAIFQRRSALAAAERQLQLLAIDVSLFLRGPEGSPLRPSLDRVPDLPVPAPQPPPDEAAEVAAALATRPELAALRAKRRQQEVELRLAENTTLPSLTWTTEASRDAGAGTASRAGAGFETGLQFSLPLQRRAATGKVVQARAKLAVIEQDLRWAEDSIRADVQDALSALAASRAILDVVRQELAVTRELEGLERDRFALGDSTQFLVNLRELATADAAAREARALADYQKALVTVEAATGRLADRVPPTLTAGRQLYCQEMRFAPEYVSNVLNDNFEDAKTLLLAPLMSIHYAHLVMLTERRIISRDDARTLRHALDGISIDAVREVEFDPACEDLFFYLERLIAQGAGEQVAGRLHTARSRNDIDMTMYRIRQREFISGLAEATLTLRRALLDLAAQHTQTIYGAHTHTQPAQVSTIAHYLLGVIEQLERDAKRLEAAYRSTNQNPLGACAITGTGFPIDRHRTSELLGFDGPTGNTYGSIATVDYLLESVSATAITVAGLGRVVQDLLLWGTMEFGYLRLADGFVQSSSIMPQKRNPVALEHARAIGSKAVGQAQAILTTVHNTPFGDIVDTEDDLQPLVASMFRDGTRMVTLVAAALKDAQFNVERLAARAGEGGTTITELADTLARDHGLPFVTAHKIAGTVIRGRNDAPATPVSDLLAAASTAVLGSPIIYDQAKVEQVLSPRYFVEIRRTLGGPAPERTSEAIGASRAALAADEAWWKGRRDALSRAAAQLRDEANRL